MRRPIDWRCIEKPQEFGFARQRILIAEIDERAAEGFFKQNIAQERRAIAPHCTDGAVKKPDGMRQGGSVLLCNFSEFDTGGK